MHSNAQMKNFHLIIYIYIYTITRTHHRTVLLEQNSLTFSRHSSLSSIAPSWSSRQYPMSVQSCYRWILVSRPTHAPPCEEVYWRTSFKSSFSLLQQCPSCLVNLIWMVLEMGGWWPYSSCFVGCWLQDLFNIAHSILMLLLFSFLSV